MRDDFFTYQAQTTPHPLALEIASAEGVYIYDTQGKKYLDFIAGVSACSLGHRHPKVIQAIKEQLDKYLHVMVYGEFIQQKPLELSKFLAQILPKPLNCTYLTNSGTEAIEGAIKLAKRYTGRSEIISAKNAYHGSTMGALSLLGVEEQKSAFRPLIPGIKYIEFNNLKDLNKINDKTAAVVIETIQGGAGFILPDDNYLKKLKTHCEATGTLLILDEIQPGFGRTGALFAFQHYNIIPDILVVGKGMGGGMPIGAFISSNQIMAELKSNPKLGHITTFGGHPLIASAALATVREITKSNLIKETLEKEKYFRKLLKHPLIKEIRGKGLMLAFVVDNAELASRIILKCKNKGVLLFWLLFDPCAIRITPPLTISKDQIKAGCDTILDVLNQDCNT